MFVIGIFQIFKANFGKEDESLRDLKVPFQVDTDSFEHLCPFPEVGTETPIPLGNAG